MSWLFYLVAIPVFVLVVMVHELGHFATAKWSGIAVEEFGLGIPPRVIGFKRGETIYSINLLPIGGFVRMRGENGEASGPDGTRDPRSFAAKPAGIRIIVLLAGVTMNVLLAIVLFTTAEAIGRVVDYQPILGQIESGSPAAQAGLATGDKIISVDGHTVKSWADFVNDVSQAADKAPANATTYPLTLVVVHAGSAQQVTITANARAHPSAGQGHLGVRPNDKYAVYSRTPILQAPLAGVKDVGTVITSTFGALWQIISGRLSPSQAVTGPVGIVQITGETASVIPQLGITPLLDLTAFLSTSLAIVNVFPFPALDGGRVVLVLLELVRGGKRLKPEIEGLINLAGLLVLVLLIVLISWSDVARWLSGQ